MTGWPEALPGETPLHYRQRLNEIQRAAVLRASAPTEPVIRQSEDDLQVAILEALAYAGVTRRALVIHIPNQGKRSPAYGAKLKAMGLMPGAADLCLIAPGGRAHFIEVKAAGGSLSRAQKEFRGSCAALGIPWASVWTPEEALEAARGWGLIPNQGGDPPKKD